MISEKPRAAKLLLQPTFRQVNRRMKLRLLLRRVKLYVFESLAFLTKLARFRIVAESIAITGKGFNAYDGEACMKISIPQFSEAQTSIASLSE